MQNFQLLPSKLQGPSRHCENSLTKKEPPTLTAAMSLQFPDFVLLP